MVNMHDWQYLILACSVMQTKPVSCSCRHVPTVDVTKTVVRDSISGSGAKFKSAVFGATFIVEQQIPMKSAIL
jgi:hypothetical protein